MSRTLPADPFGSALMWGGLGLLVYLVYLVVTPFLVPLGWAAVFAILFHPVHAKLARRWGVSAAAAATTLTVAVVLIAPMVLLVTSFAQEALQAAGSLQDAFSGGRPPRIDAIWREIEARLPGPVRVDLTTFASNAVGTVGSFVVTQSGLIARGAAGFVADLAIALFATFFLLRDANVIMLSIRRLLPLDTAAREELITRTQDLIAVGVVSSLVVAAVQGLLGGIVFAALGLSAPIFWGVVMALCCLLPLGAGVVWIPAAVLLALDGSVTRALILTGLGLGIVSGADNVLRPMLLSGKARMNGLVVLVSLLGGVSVFGLLGLVLGPIVVMTALALLSTYAESSRTDRADVTGS